MSERAKAYTVVKLAPGSYDVLLDRVLVASLVQSIDSNGSNNGWRIDLLDETAPSERPAPFTAQAHTFQTRSAALEWLGVPEEDRTPGVRFRARG